MKIPAINWIPFNSDDPPTDLHDTDYLIFLREDNLDHGKSWSYHVDVASPYGNHIDDFWNTTNDWIEGQIVQVLAYAEFPYGLTEEDLVEI